VDGTVMREMKDVAHEEAKLAVAPVLAMVKELQKDSKHQKRLNEVTMILAEKADPHDIIPKADRAKHTCPCGKLLVQHKLANGKLGKWPKHCVGSCRLTFIRERDVKNTRHKRAR